MAKQPDESDQPNFSLQELGGYDQCLCQTNEDLMRPGQADFYTIVVWKRVDFHEASGNEAWMLCRIEPQEPVDFLEYYRRQN